METLSSKSSYRVLKGPGVSKGRGCSWGTLRISNWEDEGVHLRED